MFSEPFGLPVLPEAPDGRSHPKLPVRIPTAWQRARNSWLSLAIQRRKSECDIFLLKLRPER